MGVTNWWSVCDYGPQTSTHARVYGVLLSTLGARLAEERKRLDLNQVELGVAGGVGKQAQIHYEMDRRAPNTDYLVKIQEAGVDVLYVVTGVRQGGRGALAPPMNASLFAACMTAVDAELQARGLALEAERRVRLYWGVYEMSLPQGSLNQAVVVPLVNAVV